MLLYSLRICFVFQVIELDSQRLAVCSALLVLPKKSHLIIWQIWDQKRSLPWFMRFPHIPPRNAVRHILAVCAVASCMLGTSVMTAETYHSSVRRPHSRVYWFSYRGHFMLVRNLFYFLSLHLFSNIIFIWFVAQMLFVL